MTDPLVTDARAFLGQLAKNNTRDWFQAHKATYKTSLQAPARALLDQVAAALGTATGLRIETKLFRIHRDVRFSKDKTPYNTHLHMLWREAGRDNGPGWFFGIGLQDIRTGWGWMGFDKPQIEAWRAAIAGPRGADILAAVAATGMNVGEPELKRVPAPYDSDHARGTDLRRKSLTLWSDTPDGTAASILAEFARIEPLRHQLAGVL